MRHERMVPDNLYREVMGELITRGRARRAGLREIRRELQLGEEVSVDGLRGVYDGDGHVKIRVPDGH